MIFSIVQNYDLWQIMASQLLRAQNGDAGRTWISKRIRRRLKFIENVPCVRTRMQDKTNRKLENENKMDIFLKPSREGR